MSRPLRAALGGVLAALLLVASACGSDENGPADSDATAEPSPQTSAPTPSPTEPATTAPEAKTVEIVFSGGDVDPIGKVVEVAVGETLVLDIRADEAGELHVHSTPEQEIAYPAGRSSAEIVIDRPGVVEVESHDLHKLVLQLEVR